MNPVGAMTEALSTRFKEVGERLQEALADQPKNIAWPDGIDPNPLLFAGSTNAERIGISRWELELGKDGCVYAVGQLEIWFQNVTRQQKDALTAAATVRLNATIPVGPMAPRGTLQYVVDFDDAMNSSGPYIRWGTREESRAALLALLTEIQQYLDALE